MSGWHDTDTAKDRMAFAAMVALVAHAGLILGVSFSSPEREAPAASLEVTLAQYASETPPEAAEFLAEVAQLGSGDQDESRAASTPVASDFEAALVQEVQRDSGAPVNGPGAKNAALRATSSPERAAPADIEAAAPAEAPAEQPAQRASEVASLIARLDEQSRAYAKMPRVLRFTSLSTQAADDAAYLLGWTQRVETIGNHNYPVEARRRRLYGELRLLVAVRSNGSVSEVRVLQSSGYRVLDQAAVRIVQLAAPFDPFPPELRRRGDMIEIIRTWQFRANRLSASE